ncbi:MAG TPA: type IV toxin-antitoxin system AbiEi family antitoxin [Candidatus Ozemobacteraceae bacterium]|nr:type IV toxin-antitoxin system AbiEi family antitoxin [Candidatus Ozemobacteraceae bacterium]
MGRTRAPFEMRDLVEQALAALERTTGMKGAIEKSPPKPGDRHGCLLVRLEGNDIGHIFLAECRATVDRIGALAEIRARGEHPQYRSILVTGHLTSALADACRKLDLPFIDTSGNAFVNAPGFYIFTRGNPRNSPHAQTTARNAINATSLRLLFTLLCDRDARNTSYRTMAEKAGISLGAVSISIQRLRHTGHILRAAPGAIEIDTRRCFDAWVNMYPGILRPKLHARRFTCRDINWYTNADVREVNACWSGEVAADKLLRILKPARQTIYLPPDSMEEGMEKLIRRHRLVPDPKGFIELLPAFWNFSLDSRHPDIAPAILVYADLLSSLDPRNIEIARKLYEAKIEHDLQA